MKEIYRHTTKIHNTSAAHVVVPKLLELFPIKSVLDVGCGLGTWLTVFKEKGITDILGIDGDYVDKQALTILDKEFIAKDLREDFDMGRRFDLAICLEVAEHLPESNSDQLVKNLTQHSSRIIFSAAIPGQGGQNHINEQWPKYWESLFNDYNFKCYDLIRPQIWNEPTVDVWYRQNIYLYLRNGEPVIPPASDIVTAVIHPDLWDLKIRAINELSEQLNGFDKGHAGVKRSLNALFNALRRKLKI